MTHSKDLREIAVFHFKNNKKAVFVYEALGKKVSFRTIKRWYSHYSTNGDLVACKSKGRPVVYRTRPKLKKIKRLLQSGFKGRSTAKVLKCSQTTITRAIKDLGLKPYVKTKVPLLSTVHMKKRLEFARYWRKNYNTTYSRKIFFSDEKQFSLNGIINKKNDVIYAKTREDANKKGGVKKVTKFAASIMVWCGLTYSGASRPIFLKEGETLNSNNYCSRVFPVAFADGKELIGEKFVFQQDGASSHTSKKAQEWCCRKFWRFIDKFQWPLNSRKVENHTKTSEYHTKKNSLKNRFCVKFILFFSNKHTKVS